jgi:uncharacterized protein with FMN-binding domain
MQPEVNESPRSPSKTINEGLLALAAACCLAALFTSCPAPGIVGGSAYLAAIDTVAPEVSALPDGVYSAKASVAVPMGSIAAFPWAEAEVTISGGRYAAAKLTAPPSLVEDEKYIALAARIVAAQSTEVDVVSGATFTSKAFLKAVAEAVTR